MRRGNDPKLVFSGSGNLVAFATGSDACSEHECGSEALQRALSEAYASDQSIVEALRAGRPVTYPDLRARKRISKFPEGLQFIDVPAKPGEEPQALLGYSDRADALHYFKDELRFPGDFTVNLDKNLAGAWGEGSFAIRVRGKKYVKALKGFYGSMKDGHVLFAGTFLKSKERLAGVILADERYINDESKVAMSVAQAEYESKLRLSARDDTRELLAEMRKLSGTEGRGWTGEPGHIWAKWRDAEESEVVYGLNPSYHAKADYGGPYTRQELLDWASAKFSYHLKPKRDPVARVARPSL